MLLSKEDIVQFAITFQNIIQDLTENQDFRDMEDINQHLLRVFQYNVPGGKHARGAAAIMAYRYFGTEMTEEDIKLSYVLGCCVEILQAFALIADDVMDGSETRRGKPCWYKVNGIGLSAFNDAILLENSVFQIVNKYFNHKHYCLKLVTLLHDIIYKTTYGQSLDTRTSSEKDLDTYTMDLYSAIAKYKTSYYTFVGPVTAAMTIAGITDVRLYDEVTTMMLEIGHLFQVQDDFLDCFGNKEETGKIGTDIQDGKCSWLFVVAMQHATPVQQQILKENYGKHEMESMNRVKQIYNDLDLTGKYKLYTEKTYNLISTHIQQMSKEIPKELFTILLDKIHGRKK